MHSYGCTSETAVRLTLIFPRPQKYMTFFLLENEGAPICYCGKILLFIYHFYIWEVTVTVLAKSHPGHSCFDLHMHA